MSLRCLECGAFLDLDLDGYPLPCPDCVEPTEEQERREYEQMAFDAAVDAALQRGVK